MARRTRRPTGNPAGKSAARTGKPTPLGNAQPVAQALIQQEWLSAVGKLREVFLLKTDRDHLRVDSVFQIVDDTLAPDQKLAGCPIDMTGI